MDIWRLVPTARRILERSLGLRAGERLTIVTDAEASPKVTDALACACEMLSAEPVIARMRAAEVGGVEPPPPVAAAMAATDALIIQTTAGMIHTDAARAAAASGVRFLDMWGCTEPMMVQGGLTADYDEVARVTSRVFEVLRAGREVRVATRAGTDIRLAIAGRPSFLFAGIAREPGAFSAMPEGEATVCPAEGQSAGVLAAPYVLERRDIAYPKDPFRALVEAGSIVHVEGGREASVVNAMLEEHGPPSRNIAELAIGTNRWCRLGTTLREAKKAYGTVHVGIGDNRSFGGSVTAGFHMDMIFEAPTVTVDGRAILEDGMFRIL